MYYLDKRLILLNQIQTLTQELEQAKNLLNRTVEMIDNKDKELIKSIASLIEEFEGLASLIEFNHKKQLFEGSTESKSLLKKAESLRHEAVACYSKVKEEFGKARIDISLYHDAINGFELEIERQQYELNELLNEVERNRPLDACWTKFLQISHVCTPLFHETLALLEGFLVRNLGLNYDLCLIADNLLDELGLVYNHPKIPAIPADRESFREQSNTIGIRFQEISIWNLPVVAHEFGHSVGLHLRAFQAILQREKQRGEQKGGMLLGKEYCSFVQEHFSDLVAVYTLGPAYAFNCILLRFNPQTAYQDDMFHPNSAKRMYLILKVLEKMDKHEGSVLRQYMGIIEVLKGLWQTNLVALQQPKNLDRTMIDQLDKLLDELYPIITETPLQYNGWLRAVTLSEELRPDKNKTTLSHRTEKISDVLNAAWLCRIQYSNLDSDKVRLIGEKAFNMCKDIIEYQELMRSRPRFFH